MVLGEEGNEKLRKERRGRGRCDEAQEVVDKGRAMGLVRRKYILENIQYGGGGKGQRGEVRMTPG